MRPAREEVLRKLAEARRAPMSDRKRAIADAVISSNAPSAEAPANRHVRKLIRIRRRDGQRCWLCGEHLDFRRDENGAVPGVTADHVVPRSHGGPDSIDNLRLAHSKCNNERGNAPGRPHPKWSEERAARRAMRESGSSNQGR